MKRFRRLLRRFANAPNLNEHEGPTYMHQTLIRIEHRRSPGMLNGCRGLGMTSAHRPV